MIAFLVSPDIAVISVRNAVEYYALHHRGLAAPATGIIVGEAGEGCRQ
jgi:hypothetical protein